MTQLQPNQPMTWPNNDRTKLHQCHILCL